MRRRVLRRTSNGSSRYDKVKVKVKEWLQIVQISGSHNQCLLLLMGELINIVWGA